jgi:hypothetical protein
MLVSVVVVGVRFSSRDSSDVVHVLRATRPDAPRPPLLTFAAAAERTQSVDGRRAPTADFSP